MTPTEMTEFQVTGVEALTIVCASPLAEMYQLSPCVWPEPGERAGYGLLLRSVPRRDDVPALKIARVYDGHSDDGLRFVMGDAPVLTPGPEPEDMDGCEDPTLGIVDGRYYVYYSGWSQKRGRGELLLADGPDVRHLRKRGIILSSDDTRANLKEATLVRAGDGTWRLFFEYAAGGTSRIGLASAPRVDGPWTVGPSPCASRPGRWDSWHLSTGPVLSNDPSRPVMFYNGATPDAHWRIGWVAFSPDYTQVVARSEEPLITPSQLIGDATDIAFAASAVERPGGEVWLYYSVSDKDLFRATIRRSKGNT